MYLLLTRPLPTKRGRAKVSVASELRNPRLQLLHIHIYIYPLRCLASMLGRVIPNISIFQYYAH